MKTTLITAAIVGGFFLPAHADDAHHKGTARVAQASSPLAEGEVRKVDKEAKKITLRHGPIESLDMPAMSMVFQVKDPAMLDEVKAHYVDVPQHLVAALQDVDTPAELERLNDAGGAGLK